MSKVMMTQRELIDLWREDELEIGGVTYSTVEEGEWDGAGVKYQTLGVVFTDGERFYSGTITRSGSYFSDWEYDDWGNADITEVTKVTRTIEVTRWEAV
ncbi:hypothetical protein [Paenibacillus sp. NPDC057967]|uniref:hypothetical protein n=1 Tax=Paenibacillus sp. NPDC057967 TaxID=3346293 RepID=UPI0036DC880C